MYWFTQFISNQRLKDISWEVRKVRKVIKIPIIKDSRLFVAKRTKFRIRHFLGKVIKYVLRYKESYRFYLHCAWQSPKRCLTIPKKVADDPPKNAWQSFSWSVLMANCQEGFWYLKNNPRKNAWQLSGICFGIVRHLSWDSWAFFCVHLRTFLRSQAYFLEL